MPSQPHIAPAPLCCFLETCTTADGNQVVVGGLALADVAPRSNMVSALERLTCNNRDLLALDSQLATCLQQNAWPSLVAVGACTTSKQNTASGRSGGVIGSPHQSAQSAQGQWEALGHDLWLMAHPGGPGVVVSGSQSLCQEIEQRFFTANHTPHQIAKALLPWLNAHAMAYLITLDGYGGTSPGFVAVSDGTHQARVTLSH